MQSYNVTMESAKGTVYTHACMCSSKREAGVSAMTSISGNEKMNKEGYIITDVKFGAAETVKYIDTHSLADVLIDNEE